MHLPAMFRGPFPPSPFEVLSGNGMEVTEKSAKGLSSINKIPTETNRKRQRDRRAGRGSKGYIERKAENGEESGRQTGSASRQRRTTSHCHLERGPVNATEKFAMIHIRPKSLPFNISVTMNVQKNNRSDSPIDTHRASFSTEDIKIWWRIGHWTAVPLFGKYRSGTGYRNVLMNRKTNYKRGSKLLPSTIYIKPDEADWYIGDLNKACLDEKKAQTEPTYFHVHGKFFNFHIFSKTEFSMN